MNHADHVRLIRDGVPAGIHAPVWADLGSGHGAFTLALADVLPPNAEIYSVDRDSSALHEQERAMHTQFPRANVHYHTADFTHPLALPPLDGVLMANSLHFHRRKAPILAQIRALLKPGGKLILVEYDTDRGNIWVPYPLSYPAWEALAARTGFANTRLLTTQPSRFLGRMFSAGSENH